MDDFYAARSSTKPPLPWTNFPPPFSVTLKDGASFEDRGSKITSQCTTEASFRLIIAAALAKGWTGLNIKGEEAFLRMATRIALEEGVEIQGRDDAMQAIIEDECHKLRAVNQRQPSDSSQDNFHNGLF